MRLRQARQLAQVLTARRCRSQDSNSGSLDTILCISPLNHTATHLSSVPYLLPDKIYSSHNPFLGFPGGSDSTESACNAGDLGSIPGLEDPLEKEMASHSNILA